MSDEYTSHEAPVNAARALPVALPGKLAGRETALAQVYAQLKNGEPALLYGPAGVGKTALAATLASAYAQQPGGVLWFNVSNPRLEELLVRVGRAYNSQDVTSTENPLGMVGAVENILTAHKPFIVIDGTMKQDVIARFVSRCVNKLPMVIASEFELDGPWMSFELDNLNEEQAMTLFKQEARLTTGDHDDTVQDIVELLDYQPFSIVLVARGMIASKQSPPDYLRLLQQMVDAAADSTSAALMLAFRTLTGALQGLILMLGATFSGEASAPLLSMVSGAPMESVQQAMNILSQLNLVGKTQRYDQPYYHLHSLTHTYAQVILRKSNRLDDLQAKIKTSVQTYAEQHSGSPHRLAAEMDVFLATARAAADSGDRDVATNLVAALTRASGFVNEHGYLYELLLLRELSSGASTAFPAHPEDTLVDDLLEADTTAPAGRAPSISPEDFLEETFAMPEDNLLPPDGDDEDDMETEIPIDVTVKDETQLRTMLAQAKQSGSREQQIEVLKALGKLQVEQDMENEAIATYNELLTVQEQTADDAGTLETLDMLSALMVKTENSQAAVMHASRGVKLAQELDDKQTQMQMYVTLGDAHQQLGESSQAIQEYTEGLSIARMSDDKQHEAIILYKLGYAQLDDSEPETAVDTLEKALALFKSQDKRKYEGRVLGALGSAYGDLDRWAEAMNFHTSALYIAREIGDKEEEALQLNSLAHAATEAGQLGKAVTRYRQALHLAYEYDDKDNIVSNIVDLARLLVTSRKYVSVAELLVTDALRYETNDRDLLQLKERVESEKQLAEAYNIQMIPVTGTAQDYAANAYSLLEA